MYACQAASVYERKQYCVEPSFCAANTLDGVLVSMRGRFATDARAFEQLCHRLERRGIASVVVPIRWYHWLPTLGGRSVRPILDRIHETVIRLQLVYIRPRSVFRAKNDLKGVLL